MVMRKISIKILLSVMIMFYSGNIFAQGISAEAKIDTNNVLIGDQIKLELKIKTDRKANIVWPEIQDTIGPLEVLSRTQVDTVDTIGIILHKKSYVITSFDSGMFEIPAFTFMYEKEEMPDLYPVFTQAIKIKFNTVEVDTSEAIKDIKGPLGEPITFDEYLPYILYGLGVILLLWLAYYFWKKRKPKDEIELDYDPNIPPHILALEGLKQLDGEKLWQNGHVKKYYIRLTNIIRVYLKRQFNINAMEMVKDEIITSLEHSGFDQQLTDKIAEVFSTADFAKFAKHSPLPDENAKCMTISVEFVNATIPKATDEENDVDKKDDQKNDDNMNTILEEE